MRVWQYQRYPKTSRTCLARHSSSNYQHVGARLLASNAALSGCKKKLAAQPLLQIHHLSCCAEEIEGSQKSDSQHPALRRMLPRRRRMGMAIPAWESAKMALIIQQTGIPRLGSRVHLTCQDCGLEDSFQQYGPQATSIPCACVHQTGTSADQLSR